MENSFGSRVFGEGVLFLIVSVLGIRAIIARAIPSFLSASWSVAIVMFLMSVGFSVAGISLPDVRGAPLRVGNLYSSQCVAVLAGCIVALAMLIHHILGAVLAGIATTMIVAVVMG